RILGAQEILNAAAMRQAGGAQEPTLTQSMQGHTGGMRVAAQIWVACPSAIAPLLGEQRICHFLSCIFPDACRGKSKQLQSMLIGVVRCCFLQPSSSACHAFPEFACPGRDAVALQSQHGLRCPHNVTLARGGPYHTDVSLPVPVAIF